MQSSHQEKIRKNLREKIGGKILFSLRWISNNWQGSERIKLLLMTVSLSVQRFIVYMQNSINKINLVHERIIMWPRQRCVIRVWTIKAGTWKVFYSKINVRVKGG